METKTLEKTLDVAGSVAKIAANLSEPKKEPRTLAPNDNSNNAQTGSQTVVLSMDGNKTEEAVEKHIHEFPEGRSLTIEECDLALKKASMDYELKRREQDFAMQIDNRNWTHKIEREKKNDRRDKFRRIIGGILVAIGAGGLGYAIYTDYRDNKNTATTTTTTATTEGEVK